MKLHRYLSAKENTMKSYLESVGGTIRFRKNLTPEPLSNGKNFFSFFCCPFSQFGKRRFWYLKISDLDVKRFKSQDTTAMFIFKNTCILTIMNALYPVFNKETGSFEDSPMRALLKGSQPGIAKTASIDEFKDLFFRSAIEFIRANYTSVRIDGQSFPISPKYQVSYEVGYAVREQVGTWFDTLYKRYGSGIVTYIFNVAYESSIEYYYADDPEHKRQAPVLTILPVERYASITKLRNDDPILKETYDKYVSGELKTYKQCVEFINDKTGIQITPLTLCRKFNKVFDNYFLFGPIIRVNRYASITKLRNDDPILKETYHKYVSGELKTYKQCVKFIEAKRNVSLSVPSISLKFNKLSKN